MKTRWQKTALIAGMLLLAGLFVWYRRSTFFAMLTVFALAGAFTLILSPLERGLERKGLRPHAAAAVSLFLFILCMVLVLSAFVPYLAAQTAGLIRRITPTLSALFTQGGSLPGIRIFEQKGLTDGLASMMSRLTALLARGGMAFAAQTGQVFFALVMAYYMLCERQVLAGHLLLLLPTNRRRWFLAMVLACKNAVLGYLSGLIRTSLFVAAATFAGLLLIGVRDAFVLALFMGLFEILPYIGPVLAAVPIVLTALGQGPMRALLALLVVMAVQQAEGSFIGPYFTAVTTSIHPLTALVSVFVLGSLFGLWGILLAVPLVLTLRSIFFSLTQAEKLMNP